jgi:hypothetical protein
VKLIRAFAAVLAVAACSFAQQSHSGSRSPAVSRPQAPVRPQWTPPGTSGTHIVPPSEGVATPGTGIPPLSITSPGFVPGLGATVSGYPGYHGYRRYHQGYGYGYGAYPFAVYGGDYGDYYGYGAYSDSGYPANGYGYATDPGTGPQVIINQNFVPDHATPVMRDYSGESSNVQAYDAPGRETADSSTDDGSNYYLIAFKDHSIYSAFAYWVDGDTLHYVTPQRVHNQVSLALVDRELTERLNRGRSMQVKLPN